MAVTFKKEIISPKDLLDELRWKADRVVTNPFGERVWLKQIANGLTDCCPAECPCDYHASLTHPAAGTQH